MKLHKLLTIAIVLISSPVFAGVEAPPIAAVRSNLELFVWAFGILIFILLGLVGAMVHTGNQNNKTHWEHTNRNTNEIGEVKVDVSRLQGAHEVNHPPFRRTEDIRG